MGIQISTKRKSQEISHLIIPDTQVKAGVPLDHLDALGKYILNRKPSTIVMLGDFADMPSLSYYDKGTKAGEGKNYQEDIDAAGEAMDRLLAPMKKAKKKRPRMVLTLGNHEERINKYANANAELTGKLSISDLPYDDWEVYPFLEAVEIDGILYSHFFPRGPSGSVVQTRNGSPSARAQVQREMQSCTAGHRQGLDYFIQQTGKRRAHGLIAGSFYMHEEDYLSPQGTAYWRGVIVKHDVVNGMYNPMFVDLEYLIRRYK